MQEQDILTAPFQTRLHERRYSKKNNPTGRPISSDPKVYDLIATVLVPSELHVLRVPARIVRPTVYHKSLDIAHTTQMPLPCSLGWWNSQRMTTALGTTKKPTAPLSQSLHVPSSPGPLIIIVYQR